MHTVLDALLFALAIIFWALSIWPRLASVRLELIAAGLIAFGLPFLIAAWPN